MSRIVFCGPSLPPDIGDNYPDLLFYPPVRQGDVYKAALTDPEAIGIIDGYFEGVPSVWHKEILFALDRGIKVLGAASMGALRAAELDSFGMVGIGVIYEHYRDGTLEDDDEVAVLHGPAEAGYPAVSLPMVNLRATLDAAIEAGIIDAPTGVTIAARAKAVHYKDRTWTVATQGYPTFAAWVETHCVDQKRLDAGALLTALSGELDFGPAPDFAFAKTFVFQRAVADWTGPMGDDITPDDMAVLEELALDPALYYALRDPARLRRLTGAARDAGRADGANLRNHLARLRSGHGLLTRTALDVWLEANRLDEKALQTALKEDARLEALEANSGPLTPDFLSELKLSGHYAALAERAADKAERLAGPALQTPPPPVLISAFEQAHCDWPDHIAIWQADFGLEDRQEIYRVLARDHLYCRLLDET